MFAEWALTSFLWLLVATLIGDGVVLCLLFGLCSRSWAKRHLRRLTDWVDSDERARRLIRRHRLLTRYNELRDEEKRLAAELDALDIQMNSEIDVLREQRKSLKQTTEIRQRQERLLLDD